MGAVPAEAATGSMSGRFLIIGLVVLLFSFLPSALAVLKGNFNKGQVIKYQLVFLAINIVIAAVIFLVQMFIPIGVPRMIMAIAGGVWALVCIVLWFYVLLNALKDTQMTLF